MVSDLALWQSTRVYSWFENDRLRSLVLRPNRIRSHCRFGGPEGHALPTSGILARSHGDTHPLPLLPNFNTWAFPTYHSSLPARPDYVQMHRCGPRCHWGMNCAPSWASLGACRGSAAVRDPGFGLIERTGAPVVVKQLVEGPNARLCCCEGHRRPGSQERWSSRPEEPLEHSPG